MIQHVKELLKRARYILNNSDFKDLIRRSYTHFIFEGGTYNYYEHQIMELKETDFLPLIEGITVKTVHNNQEADELCKEQADFRNVIFDASNMLNKGAIAICIYKGRNLAHITWIALSRKAQKAIYALPYTVDYVNKEACVGGTYTNPKYRGKNLMVYGNYLKFRYLKENGIITVRHAIKTDNFASIAGYKRFSPVLRAVCTYLRLFRFQYWKEKRIS